MNLLERNALLEAAKQLVRKGWCQGAYGMTVEGDAIETDMKAELAQAVCSCATGATAWVSENRRKDQELLLALKGAVLMLLPNACGNVVVDYNDAPGRTQAEVVRLFDLAKEMAL